MQQQVSFRHLLERGLRFIGERTWFSKSPLLCRQQQVRPAWLPPWSTCSPTLLVNLFWFTDEGGLLIGFDPPIRTRNASTSACGRSLMKPTVSLSTTSRPPGSITRLQDRRVEGTAIGSVVRSWRGWMA